MRSNNLKWIFAISLSMLSATVLARLPPNGDVPDPAETDSAAAGPVTVYTSGIEYRQQSIGRWEFAPVASPVWADGVHTSWSSDPEMSYAVAADGRDLYSLGSEYDYLIKPLTLRRNGVLVRTYPILPWQEADAKSKLFAINGDVYVARMAVIHLPDQTTRQNRTQLFKNGTVIQELGDDFRLSAMHGSMRSLSGRAEVVLGGSLRDSVSGVDKATVIRGGFKITLAQEGSSVTALHLTSSGWIHAVGYANGGATYWKISPANVVTKQLLSKSVSVPFSAADRSAVVHDIHVSSWGTVYVAGEINFLNLLPVVSTLNTKAVVWVNGLPAILPGGDFVKDCDSATAVTSDANGDYYVTGVWRELCDNPQYSSFAGAVWKNGALWKIADNAYPGADSVMPTGIAVTQ